MRGAAMARDPLLAQIHIAKKDLGLQDDVYRDVVERVTGKRSSADLNDTGRRKLIAEFRRMGWNGGWKRRENPTGRRRGSAAGSGRAHSHKPYVRKIFAQWKELRRLGIWRGEDVATLRAFVRKMTGCDNPEWLKEPQARKVIEALKKIKERAQ